MTDDLLTRLARLDACAISDALDQHRLPPSIIGLPPRAAQRRICGQVLTVKLAAGPSPAGAPLRHLCTTTIDAGGPSHVIVVEQSTGIECACWGGILSNAARARGIAGVILEGLARDVDEALQIDFPVYARGCTARTARGRIHEQSAGGPIRVGGVPVSNGDYVVADGSGVAFIPNEHITAVIDTAEQIARKEAAITKAVMSGHPVSKVMGADYELLLAIEPKS
jgi:4-hydroxy-4-methyl-2-oxoglutarate aldolase